MTDLREPHPGTPISELETPVLLVELDVFERNMATMQSFCEAHHTLWRPHSKCHKCPDIARLELQAGAAGITCAKLGEAELMVAQGIGPVLIANEVVTPTKLSRLAQLQLQQQVMVAVDDLDVVSLIGRAGRDHGVRIPVLIEIDIGMHRVGVQPGSQVLELGRRIADTPGIDLKGIMGYEGHVLAISPPEEKVRACHGALDLLLESQTLLQDNGLEAEIVSAGGTGCYEITGAYAGITEIQAGGGVFMDAMYRQLFHVESLEYALTCLATVTSRSASHVVVDAGFKTMSAYHHPPFALDRSDLQLDGLSAEHGVFALTSGAAGPRVGEQVRFVVGYSDSTAVLHDRFIGVREGCVECIWKIAGRGLLQ